jgi:hypothetical protein
VGLAGERTPAEVIDQLLPTIRFEMKFEADRLREADFEGFYRFRETASVAENAVALAEFLDISPETAREIAATDYLFVD